MPFGLPDGPAPEATGALRAAFPVIGSGDRVLLWGGGIWDWLDAETPLPEPVPQLGPMPASAVRSGLWTRLRKRISPK